jgi:hypothetical protein
MCAYSFSVDLLCAAFGLMDHKGIQCTVEDRGVSFYNPFRLIRLSTTAAASTNKAMNPINTSRSIPQLNT